MNDILVQLGQQVAMLNLPLNHEPHLGILILIKKERGINHNNRIGVANKNYRKQGGAVRINSNNGIVNYKPREV